MLNWCGRWVKVSLVEADRSYRRRDGVFITADPGTGPRRLHYWADEWVRVR